MIPSRRQVSRSAWQELIERMDGPEERPSTATTAKPKPKRKKLQGVVRKSKGNPEKPALVQNSRLAPILAFHREDIGELVRIRLPLRTERGLNAREHWAARSKRVKVERTMAYTTVPKMALPAVVKLIRHSPGTLDGDNLQGALKGVRDGVADRLGVDDRDPRVTWEYDQTRMKGHGVTVELRPAPKEQ